MFDKLVLGAGTGMIYPTVSESEAILRRGSPFNTQKSSEIAPPMMWAAWGYYGY